jgi:hypothetical protein
MPIYYSVDKHHPHLRSTRIDSSLAQLPVRKKPERYGRYSEKQRLQSLCITKDQGQSLRLQLQLMWAKTDILFQCDEAPGFCNNCSKGNRTCMGYNLGTKFQDEGPKLRRKYLERSTCIVKHTLQRSSSGDRSTSSSSESSASPPCSRIQQSAVFKSSEVELKSGNDQRIPDTIENFDEFMKSPIADNTLGITEPLPSIVFEGTQSRFNSYCAKLMLNPSLASPDVEQQQLLHIFTFSIAPTPVNHLTAAGAAVPTHGPWLARLPALTGRNKLLDSTVRAVTIAHFGRLDGCSSFLSEARPYYGKALRLLSLALADPIEAHSAEVLGATILLSLYEMFASDPDDSWLRHAGGAAALMRIRGAAQHRYGFHRELFLAYRPTLIIEAARSRVHCFLEEPEWLEVAEQIREDCKSCQVGGQSEHFNAAEDFTTEYVHIPGLICDAANLKLTPGSAYGTGSSMKKDITTRAESLRTNIKLIFVRFSLTLQSLGQGPVRYASNDPIIPVYYRYTNIFVATLHNNYRAMLMLLNILIREMDPLGPDAGLHKTETREAALDCCRSECFMQKSSYIGPFSSINTLRLALVLLEPVAEREWVFERLYKISNTKMSMEGREFPSQAFAPAPLVRIRVAVEEIDRMERLAMLKEMSPEEERLKAYLKPQEVWWQDSIAC